MKRVICITALCWTILAAAACRQGTLEKSEERIRKTYPGATVLNDTAAFIAGLPTAESSSFSKLAASAEYARYRSRIDAMWERYMRNNLEKTESWRRENIEAGHTTVFYPFSGPDILNALAFFPDAGEYIMMGLEPPGSVPEPLSIAPRKVHQGLAGVRNALRTLLLLNLFRTSEMQADLHEDSISNTTGIMMFFLARSGREILDIRAITVPASGPGGDSAGVRGVEISFRKGVGSPVQRALYLSVDISDESLDNKPEFVAFMREKCAATTFMKSASYLLSYDNFETLRSLLLERSRRIIQDDTAIPYKYFDEKQWEMTFYGRYRVLEMFKGRFQADLDRAVRQRSTGPLPFACGYGFIPAKSNLMIAKRRDVQSKTGPRL